MKKSARKPLISPGAIARKIVDDTCATAGDWRSDFVFSQFIEADGTLTAIVGAATEARHAREAAGLQSVPETAMDEQEAVDHDYDEACFQLGFALGAKFGGSR